jgi:ATP dependent DNA ligase domain.
MIDVMNSLPESEHIIVVENELIANDSVVIENRGKELQRQGWEGVVLRHPTISYEEGDSHKLVKLVVYHQGVYK